MVAGREQWTFGTLLIHIKALLDEAEKRTSDRFAAQEKATATALAAAEKAVTAALASQEKAVALAEGNAEKWRASANEWRGAMDDREGSFVKVGEYNLLLGQVKEMRETMASIAGRGQGRGDVWAWIVAAVMALLAIGSFLFRMNS